MVLLLSFLTYENKKNMYIGMNEEPEPDYKADEEQKQHKE